MHELDLWNYIVISFDEESTKRLQEQEIPCVNARAVFNLQVDSEFSRFGQKHYVRMTGVKSAAANAVVNLDLRPVIIDADVVLLRDPLPFLRKKADEEKYDIIFQDDTYMVCTGFYYAVPTQNSKMFLAEVLNLIEASKYEKIDQYVVHDQLADPYWKHTLRFMFLDHLLFPVGKAFFQWKNANHHGLVPYLVHNNWVVGNEIKEHRFKEHLLWWREPDEYYQGHFLSFSFENDGELPRADEYMALRNAFAIASLLKRIVILPKFRCRSRHRPDQEWCTLDYVETVDDLYREFPNQFRENSILFNPRSPSYVREPPLHSLTFDIHTNRHSVPPNDIVHEVLYPKNQECGATSEEILEWLGRLSNQRHIHFLSLHERFVAGPPLMCRFSLTHSLPTQRICTTVSRIQPSRRD